MLCHFPRLFKFEIKRQFESIMEKPWSAFILIADFVWKLQDFLKKIVARRDDLEFLKTLGTYHEGYNYLLEEFCSAGQLGIH